MAANEPKQGMASIGVDIKVNSVAMNYVQDFSDMGGTPSDLDATCLKDRMKHFVPGVQETKAWEVTYLFDNASTSSDFRKLKALQTAGNVVPVEVSYPDGTKFASTGYVSTYPTGAKVDDLLLAKAIISLQSDWSVTNPSAT